MLARAQQDFVESLALWAALAFCTGVAGWRAVLAGLVVLTLAWLVGYVAARRRADRVVDQVGHTVVNQVRF